MQREYMSVFNSSSHLFIIQHMYLLNSPSVPFHFYVFIFKLKTFWTHPWQVEAP